MQQLVGLLLIASDFLWQASKVGGVYDHQDSCDLQLLLARYWWRVRVKRLLEGSQKPTMKQIQLHIKEVGPLIEI